VMGGTALAAGVVFTGRGLSAAATISPGAARK
jgi:hypothetical protein